MDANRRSRDDPASGAYSRITNPERFQLLHRLGVDWVDRLEATYRVDRAERFEWLPWMAPFEHARPPATLSPAVANAAPIAIAFTLTPGLVIRMGEWASEYFPSCACDACAETAEGEGARLEETIQRVISGQLREEVTIPWFDDASLAWSVGEIGGVAGLQRGWCTLSRAHARALGLRGSRELRWAPWPKRHPDE